MRVWRSLIAAMVFAAGASIIADEWLAPSTRNVFSPNGQFFVRIVPRTTNNPQVASADAPKPVPARGEFYARGSDRSYRLVADVALQNPVSPVYATVTDSGYLVTFDDWFGTGYGNVIVFYRPNGELIRRLSIDDLYSPEQVASIPRSVSSRRWRCGLWYTPPQKAGGEESLSVQDYRGGSFLLDAQAGTVTYRQTGGKCDPATASIF